jgi:hypothetical protein
MFDLPKTALGERASPAENYKKRAAQVNAPAWKPQPSYRQG